MFPLQNLTTEREKFAVQIKNTYNPRTSKEKCIWCLGNVFKAHGGGGGEFQANPLWMDKIWWCYKLTGVFGVKLVGEYRYLGLFLVSSLFTTFPPLAARYLMSKSMEHNWRRKPAALKARMSPSSKGLSKATSWATKPHSGLLRAPEATQKMTQRKRSGSPG